MSQNRKQLRQQFLWNCLPPVGWWEGNEKKAKATKTPLKIEIKYYATK